MSSKIRTIIEIVIGVFALLFFAIEGNLTFSPLIKIAINITLIIILISLIFVNKSKNQINESKAFRFFKIVLVILFAIGVIVGAILNIRN